MGLLFLPSTCDAGAGRRCPRSGYVFRAKEEGGGLPLGCAPSWLLVQDHDYWRCGEAEVRAPAARTAVRRNRHGGRAVASSKNFLPSGWYLFAPSAFSQHSLHTSGTQNYSVDLHLAAGSCCFIWHAPGRSASGTHDDL